MSRPPIQLIKINDSLTLSERHPDSECRTVNWWLYDDRAGMNIAMRAKSKDEAFVQVIEYWARKAQKYEDKYDKLKDKVDSFVGQFAEPADDNLYG